MLPREGSDESSGEQKSRLTGPANGSADSARADFAKAAVVDFLSQFVAAGFATSTTRDDGDVELRFNSGEIYILADSSVTRIA